MCWWVYILEVCQPCAWHVIWWCTALGPGILILYMDVLVGVYNNYTKDVPAMCLACDMVLHWAALALINLYMHMPTCSPIIKYIYIPRLRNSHFSPPGKNFCYSGEVIGKGLTPWPHLFTLITCGLLISDMYS